MTMPKGLTAEERHEWYSRRWFREKNKMISDDTYHDYLEKRRQNYMNWSPEQRLRNYEATKRSQERQKQDPNRYEVKKERSRQEAYRKSKCYGCEYWKLIRSAYGVAGGTFHYCKKYLQANTPYKRKKVCPKLQEKCQTT